MPGADNSVVHGRRAHAGRRAVATLLSSRRAWHVLAALALVTVTLAVLSIQSVRREAIVRRNLVVDTHRAVANLVSARLSDAIAEGERSIAGAAQAGDRSPDAILDALDEIERARPWLGPVVVVAAQKVQAPANEELAGPSLAAASFASLLAAAEREELILRNLAAAAGLYSKAAAVAPTPARRLEALNGLARTEFKAGRLARAIAAYDRIVASADSFDPVQARWAVLAHDQRIRCDLETGDRTAVAGYALERLSVSHPPSLRARP